MSLKAQCRAASTLMMATPPCRSNAALKGIVRLRGGDPANEPAFIAHLLGTANRTHNAMACAGVNCGRAFLATEFNREGDAYRCPWCNAFTTAQGRSYPRPLNLMAKTLRRLEKRFIERFDEYARLYFGDQCVTNCYVWSDDGTADNLGVAVLIVNECDKEAVAKSTQSDAPAMGGTWNSTHVFNITVNHRDTRVDYRATSTIFVDIGAGPCRFSGFIERRHPVGHEALTEDLYDHVVAVGSRVQRVENTLRDEIAAVQFAKAAVVVSALRAPAQGGRSDGNLPRGRGSVDDPLLAVAPVASPPKPASASAVKAPAQSPPPLPPPRPAPTAESVNKAAVVAPPPPQMPVPTVVPKAAASADRATAPPAPPVVAAPKPPPPPPPPPQPEPAEEEVPGATDDQPEEEEAAAAVEEEEAAAEGAEVAEGEWTLEQILESLELDDVPGVLHLLNAGAVYSVEDLMQCDDAYLKQNVGLPKPARKALVEWISWQFGEEEEEQTS
jgi:hypothetical protein